MAEPSRRRVAVVTGASRGIGRGIALALAGSGHDLVINWIADGEAAEYTAELVRSLGICAMTVRADVADPAAMSSLAWSCVERFGRLDVWVNNAGVSMIAPIVQTTAHQLRAMLDVNVIGVLNGMTSATTAMRALIGQGVQAGGRIVNLASDLGLQVTPLLGGYAATKFAVIGLTQAGAIELSELAITVNAVCPGTAETDMVHAERAAEGAVRAISPDQIRHATLATIPTRRFCTPADVGGMVAYLASDAASYVTGQSMCVNGGSVLH